MEFEGRGGWVDQFSWPLSLGFESSASLDGVALGAEHCYQRDARLVERELLQLLAVLGEQRRDRRRVELGACKVDNGQACFLFFSFSQVASVVP